MARIGKPVLAVMIMGAIIAVMMMLCTPRTASKSSAIDPGPPAARP